MSSSAASRTLQAASPTSAAPGTPGMVGRQPQLAALRHHLEQAREGGARVVLVLGEAGVGKTCLVRELAGPLCAERGVEVLEGRCYDESPAVPYGPFLDAVRALVRARGAEAVARQAGCWAPDLAKLLPELEAFAGPCRAPADAAAEKRRLFEAICRVLRPSPGGTAVLVVEDLHWADVTSQELLVYLAHAAAGDPLLVVATCRTEGGLRPPALLHLAGLLRRERRCHEVQVGPLTRDELSRVLQRALGHAVPGRLADALFDRTDGNPFFAEEIVRALAEGGRLDALVQAAGEGERIDRLEIPASVRESILVRAAELDEPSTEALRYAAVIGRRFDFELLRRVTGQDEEQLVRSLERLVRHHFVAEEAEGPADRYGFRHALTREAVYGALLGRDRWRRHRAVLGALEQAYAACPEQAADALAYHSVQAGEMEKAAAYSRAAGDRARRMHAYREAAAHYEVALDVMADAPPAERARLAEQLGKASLPFADPAVYTRHFRQAQRLYREAGNRRKVGDIHRRLGECAWQRGDGAEAVRELHAAIHVLEAEAPGIELAMAYGEMAAVRLLGCDVSEALQWGRRALELAERHGDDEVRSYALNWIGCALVELDAPDEGLAHLERSLALARAAGSPGAAIRAYTNLGANLRALGHYRRAAEVLREGAAFADGEGWESGRGRLTGNLAFVEMELGHWDRARELLDQAVGAGSAGHAAARFSALPWQADLAHRRGRADLAAATLEAALPEFQQADDVRALWMVYPVLARARLALGDPAGAAEAMDRAAGCWRRGGSGADPNLLGAAVEVYLQAGRGQAAGEMLDALASAAARAPTPLGTARLADARALAAADAGDPDTAGEEFARAAEAWRGMGAVFQEARSRRRRAEVLLRAGDPALRRDAAAELRAACGAFSALGAAREHALAADVARRHGLASVPRPAEPAGAAEPAEKAVPASRSLCGLSRRELAVLRLVAAGKSNREVAREAFVAESTVKTHTKRIYRKLGVGSRTEAVARARALRLLEP